MLEKINGKKIKIGIALMTTSKFSESNVTKYFEGIVTGQYQDFIELDNKFYFSKKFIQTIEIVE